MSFADLLGQAGIKLPEGAGTGAVNFIQAFIFFLIFAIVAGIITYLIANKRQYNKKIHIFEEVAGRAQGVGDDFAKEIILPNTSVRAFFLKKRKLYLPRPTLQVGKGHYWYFVRKDGEWINIELENLNKKLTELKIAYDHTDMRMANASLKKLIEKNYKKLNWLKEYAPYIAMGLLIFLLAISAFLVLNQANKVVGALAGSAEINVAVAERLEGILISMDRICTGSGVRTVTSGGG